MSVTITETWSTATTADGPMRLYVARPDSSGPFPGVVVLQEAFGVNDHIQDVCRRYAALGYVAAAPELFHREGVETVPYGDRGTAMRLIGQVTDDQAVADISAAVETLRDGPGVGDVAVAGYCFGGRCAYLAAARVPGLAAAVVYYGGGIVTGEPGAPIDSTSAIGCPVLAHFGERDGHIPPEQVLAIAEALEDAGVDHAVVSYPEAGHAFACDARPAYFHAEAANAAWGMTTAFLSAAFAGDSMPARTVSPATGVVGGGGPAS